MLLQSGVGFVSKIQSILQQQAFLRKNAEHEGTRWAGQGPNDIPPSAEKSVPHQVWTLFGKSTRGFVGPLSVEDFPRSFALLLNSILAFPLFVTGLASGWKGATALEREPGVLHGGSRSYQTQRSGYVPFLPAKYIGASTPLFSRFPFGCQCKRRRRLAQAVVNLYLNGGADSFNLVVLASACLTLLALE